MALSENIEVGTVCPDGGRIDLNILVREDKSGAVEIRFSGPGDLPEERTSLIMTADEFDTLRSLILRVERHRETLVMRDKMRSWIHSAHQRDAVRQDACVVPGLPDLAVSGDGAGSPVA